MRCGWPPTVLGLELMWVALHLRVIVPCVCIVREVLYESDSLPANCGCVDFVNKRPAKTRLCLPEE